MLGRHLTAQELDVATGGRKVWVQQISNHASVVSTAVLDELDRELVSGDDAGVGLFKELDQNAVLRHRLPYSVEEVGSLIVAAAEQARTQGITTCVDAGNGGEVGALSLVDGAAYLAALEAGRLPVRMQLMPSIDVLAEVRTHQADGFRRALATRRPQRVRLRLARHRGPEGRPGRRHAGRDRPDDPARTRAPTSAASGARTRS